MIRKNKMKISDVLMIAGGCAVAAAIIGGILNCLVFPIGYIIMHDCGKWICSHSYPMTWESYAIVTGIMFVLLFIIAIIGENASYRKPTSIRRTNQTYKRRSSQTYNSRETDYYDSDMEGAPGYNGFD